MKKVEGGGLAKFKGGLQIGGGGWTQTGWEDGKYFVVVEVVVIEELGLLY